VITASLGRNLGIAHINPPGGLVAGSADLFARMFRVSIMDGGSKEEKIWQT
jgi:hypothetical protein